MRIAFLGLGQMGAPMAHRLIEAGHALTVWNRSAEAALPFRDLGATVAGSPAEAADGAEAFVTVLSDDAAVESVVLGRDGLLSAFAPGALHVSCSTISVDLARRLAEAHGERGQDMVSVPLFGRPEAVVAGTLNIGAAGRAEALRRAEPILSAVGGRTFVFGEEPWIANLVKLANNFVLAASMQALGEAFALLRKSGVDAGTFQRFLQDTDMGSRIVTTYGGIIAAERYSPPGAKLTIGVKDMGLVLDAAASAEVPLRSASLVRDQFLTAVARGYGGLDWAAIARVSADDAGIT